MEHLFERGVGEDAIAVGTGKTKWTINRDEENVEHIAPENFVADKRILGVRVEIPSDGKYHHVR